MSGFALMGMAMGVMDPRLPHGRRIELPGRGTTFVREVEGPPGAPTLLLLHGWVASGGMNWYQCFESLSRHFNIVAPDVRGHGRGLRTRKVFRLADCADDCAETLVQLGHDNVIAVGYSMGGPIAQLLWRRHRDLVSGLVLCATSGGFIPNRYNRRIYQSYAVASAGAMRLVAAARVPSVVPNVRLWPRALPTWAAEEVRRHDWRMIVEAGQSLSTYNATKWLGDIDVPTAVVCTTKDQGVRPDQQRALASAIPSATVHELAEGHLACAKASFAPVLLHACLDVADRIPAHAAAFEPAAT